MIGQWWGRRVGRPIAVVAAHGRAFVPQLTVATVFVRACAVAALHGESGRGMASIGTEQNMKR